MKIPKESLTSILSLFTSASTLVCCALPALFVTLGAGAVLAGIVSSVPQLIWFSEHKLEVFSGAGLMLALAGYLQWRARNAPCPVDPALRDTCLRLRKSGQRIYIFSCAIFMIGVFFAFVAPRVIG